MKPKRTHAVLALGGTAPALRGGASIVLLALLAGACGGDVKPATAVVIELRGDGDEKLASIDITIRDALDGKAGGQHRFELAHGLSLPLSFAVVPRTGAASSTFVVVATGRDQDGGFVVESKAKATFVQGETLSFTLYLLAACRGVMCDAGLTCDPTLKSCSAIPRPKLVPFSDNAQSSMKDAGSHIDGGMDGGMDGGPHEAGGLQPEAGPQMDAGPDTGMPEDAGPDTSKPPVPDAGVDMAIEKAGTACAKAGDRACPGHDAATTLVCKDGKWSAGSSCGTNQTCDAVAGNGQGKCTDVAPLCIGRSPNDEVCDGTTRRRCDADREGYLADACPAHAHCDDSGASAQCSCDTSYMDDGSGHCTPVVTTDTCTGNTCGHGTCVPGASSYTCTCDPGYSGTTTCNPVDECSGTTVCNSDYVCWDETPGYRCIGQFADWPMPDSTPGAKVAPGYTLATNTVTDNVTGLMWVRALPTSFDNCIGPAMDIETNTCNYDESVAYCANLNFAGFTDWRLPSKIELESIIDYTQSDASKPTIDTTVFPTPMAGFWTESPVTGMGGYFWHISFTDATTGANPSGYSYAVRCVRNP